MRSPAAFARLLPVPVLAFAAGAVLAYAGGAQAAKPANAAAIEASSEAPVETSTVASADAPVEGLWHRHELDFHYFGRTSFYTCESLEQKLRDLLDAAGARPGFRTRARGCEDAFERVARFPVVRLEFHTLAPAEEPAAPKPPPVPERRLGRDVPPLVPAHVPQPGTGAWRTVELGPKLPRGLSVGDCELLEQFRRDVLPKFHTRIVEDRVRCVPYQRSGSQVRLRFESLGALPDADRPASR